MSVECFMDTNVLVYSVSRRPTEVAKRKRAFELLETTNFGLSGQVLQEFFVTVTRKSDPKVTNEKASNWLRKFEHVPTVPVEWNLVMKGIGYSERYKISYWDGAIIAAAEELNAEVVYTEDLNDGQQYGTVRAENPFRELN